MTTRAPAMTKIVTTSSDYSRHRGRAFTLIRVADRTSLLALQHFAATFNTSNKLSKHFLCKKCFVAKSSICEQRKVNSWSYSWFCSTRMYFKFWWRWGVISWATHTSVLYNQIVRCKRLHIKCMSVRCIIPSSHLPYFQWAKLSDRCFVAAGNLQLFQERVLLRK